MSIKFNTTFIDNALSMSVAYEAKVETPQKLIFIYIFSKLSEKMSKATKITIEFEDGTVHTFRGQDAKYFQSQINGAIGFAYVHGENVNVPKPEVSKKLWAYLPFYKSEPVNNAPTVEPTTDSDIRQALEEMVEKMQKTEYEQA